MYNDRQVDALGPKAFAALTNSPGARSLYYQLRAGHRAAFRQLGNCLVGIVHGCLKTATLHSEAKAWPTHKINKLPLDRQTSWDI